VKFKININYKRDELLTVFGKSLLRKYYIKNSSLTYQEFFAKIACAYTDNDEDAQYIYDQISQLRFWPATPTLANGIYAGSEDSTHLPISCYLNSVENNKNHMISIFHETMQISLGDGGLGTNWSKVASLGDYIDNQESTGVISMIKAQSNLLRVFGGSTREYGSCAAYLDVSHPDIEQFIEMRKPAIGADQEQKVPRHMHHGVIITDNFIRAVEEGKEWHLKSVTRNHTLKTVNARHLWEKILRTRVETGEPFLVFIDNVNRQRPEILKKLKLNIEMSNLCTEILLPTGLDHLNNLRTAICCLGSINLEYFDEWSKDDKFFYVIGKFLDNVRLDFINRAPESMKRAVYATKRDGAIGLGVSGYSTYLQSKMIPLESEEANDYNNKIFKHIKDEMDKVSYKLAVERGACEDAAEVGAMERFTHKIALKPDALTAFFFNVSPNTEVSLVNYNYKTLHGSHTIKNKIFEKLLIEKNKNTDEIWSSILTTGNIDHLDFLTDIEKAVFKSPYQINPLIIVKQAADRQKYICQGASLNIRTFLPISAKLLHDIHMMAAKYGIKTMYYLECKSTFRTENTLNAKNINFNNNNNNEVNNNEVNNKSKPNILGDVCIGCE
jgi:ribonucleoside-diphosphate reductase alpha chain